jgi:OmcA/MtrC family decaheme c-type cytochrome
MLALAATIGLAGCEGDDSKDDVTGPIGPTGPVGPTGPTGPSDIGIEQGGPVTIGDGTTLTPEQIAQIGGLVATIDSATIASAPVVEFTVKTAHDGPVLGISPRVLNFMVAKLVPAANGLPSRWQSYVNRTQTASSSGPMVLPSATQATTENGANGTLVELGEGKYRYTYKVDLANVTTPIAVAYQPSATHRVGLEIRMSGEAEALAPDNPVLDLVPDAGAGSGHKLIAATENCETCHLRFEMHGGPRRSVEYCVTCHNPGTVDPDGGEDLGMAYLAHSIHTGDGRGYTSANPSPPPTNIFNPLPYIVYGFGGTAHDYGEVTYPQSTLFCENCHTASEAAPDGDAWKDNPSASACGGCHVEGLQKTGPDAATGRYAYQYQHNTLDFVANDGICVDCHRAGGPAGAILASHQKPVFGSGNRNLRYSVERGREFTYEILSVTNAAAGQSPTVQFRILDKGQPIDVKSLTAADGNLTLDFAWNTRDIHTVADLATGTLAGDRGRALQVSLITNMASVIARDGGVYEYTLADPLPSGVDGDLMVALEGRRQFADNSRAYPESAIFFPGQKRPALVSQEKCENCHELLAIHGGNRAGDPLMCTVCHNSSGGWSDEGFGPIALGAFAHNIHAGKIEEFEGVTYPQSLARCETCHLEGSYNTARTDALPISTGPGPDQDPNANGVQNQNLYDDTWSSATAGTCGTCHDSGAARVHMEDNGGQFDVVGGKTLTPSSSSEACSVCHGPGRSVDTAAAHAGSHAE